MHFDPGTQCTINGWAAGTVVGEWGCWTAAEPESGKPEIGYLAPMLRKSVGDHRLQTIEFVIPKLSLLVIWSAFANHDSGRTNKRAHIRFMRSE